MAALTQRPPPHDVAPFSTGRVVLAGVLVGIGVLLMSLWLVTVTANWVYFLGVIPMALGTYMLFRPTTGTAPEHLAGH